MKSIIYISIAILLFFGFAFWTQASIVDTADKMVKRLDLIEEAIYKEEWEFASDEISSIKEQWEDICKKWQMLIDHQEIDNINSTLVRTKAWIDLESREDCISEIAALKLYVLHVPERKALRITNIF